MVYLLNQIALKCFGNAQILAGGHCLVGGYLAIGDHKVVLGGGSEVDKALLVLDLHSKIL